MFSERRSSFRSPVVGSREGTLVVNRSRLRVRLIDESSGGMSVASETMPTFPEGAVGELETDDGDVYRVQVKHIQPRGMCARIGLQRLEVLAHGGKKTVSDGSRRPDRRKLTTLVFIGAGLFFGLAAQADPVRRQLSRVPGFSKFFSEPQERLPVTPGEQISKSVRQRLREEFDIDLFAEPEVAILLQLRPEQMNKIRSVIDAKNSVIRASVPRTQQAAVLYITQMAMLGVLDTDQKYRLESLLEHTIGATDLLQKLVMQYWPTADAQELYKRLGAPALALPQVAEKLELDPKQLRAVRQIVDDALDKSEALCRKSTTPSTNEEAFLTTAFGYLGEAEAKCMAVLTEQQRAELEKMKG